MAVLVGVKFPSFLVAATADRDPARRGALQGLPAIAQI